MNRALKTVGLIILSVCPIFIQAQSSTWTNYRDLDAVKIDYILQNCGEEPNTITEFYFIRLTNKTENPINVSFKLEYYYNGVCSTCGNEEYVFNLLVPANGSIMPDCASLTTTNGHLAVVKRYVNRNYGSPLDRFELSNIAVH